MPVKFQKFVLVSNPRIECLYIFVSLLLAVALVCKFVWLQEYLDFYEVGPYIHISMWPDMATTAELDALYNAATDSCSGLDGFCIPPCTNGRTLEYGSCVYSERLGVSMSENEVLFATAVTIQNLSDGSEQVHYLPYEDAASLRFSFSLSLPSSIMESDIFSRRKRLGWSDPLYSSNMDHLLTVILNRDGMVYRVEEKPDHDVELSMDEILHLAGLGTEWLDRVQPTAGLRGESDVVGRLSGVAIALSVECFDDGASWQYGSEEIIKMVKSREVERICAISLIPSTERSSRMDAAATFTETKQLLHGIHITAQTGGFWSRFNYIYIYDALVQAYVLSKIPKIFVLFVTTYLLGHLSKIYWNIIYEVFDIAEQVAGTAVRFMSNTVSFEELCHEEDDGFTKETMLRRITQAMRRSKSLKESDLHKFVDFSVKAIMDLMHFTKHDSLSVSLKHDAKSMAKHMRRVTTATASLPVSGQAEESAPNLDSTKITNSVSLQSENTMVDEGSFVRACSSIDKVTIQDAVKLFSRDRRVGRLEKFFMPRYIRTLVQRSQLGTWAPRIEDLMRPNGTISRAGQRSTTLSSQFKFAHYDDHDDHETHGTKAYKRVIDLEARHRDLEQMAKGNVAQKDLEHMIRRLLFPETVVEEEETDEPTRDMSSQSCVYFQIPRPDGEPASVDPPADEDGDSGTPVKDLVLSRREAEKATQMAVATARAEVLEQVSELVGLAVQEARQSVLAEVERAIGNAVKSPKRHLQPPQQMQPLHLPPCGQSDCERRTGGLDERRCLPQQEVPYQQPQHQHQPMEKDAFVTPVPPRADENLKDRRPWHLSYKDVHEELFPDGKVPPLGARLEGLGSRGTPSRGSSAQSSPPPTRLPPFRQVGGALGFSVEPPAPDTRLGNPLGGSRSPSGTARGVDNGSSAGFVERGRQQEGNGSACQHRT